MADEKTISGSQAPTVMLEQDRSRPPVYRSTEFNDDKETHKGTVAAVVPSLEKHKEASTKNLTGNVNKKDHSPESIELTSLKTDKRRGAIVPSHPIPADVRSINSAESDLEQDKGEKGDEDEVTGEKQLTGEVKDEQSEWSDDEEAGGLPRSDSRASRVSRVVRQLFCCGVAYEAASEENLSTQRRHYREAI